MALSVDLDPGDILVVPPDSGAQIRITEKTGRRTRVSIESAKPVQVLKARDAARPSSGFNVQRPRGAPAAAITRPKT